MFRFEERGRFLGKCRVLGRLLWAGRISPSPCCVFPFWWPSYSSTVACMCFPIGILGVKVEKGSLYNSFISWPTFHRAGRDFLGWAWSFSPHVDGFTIVLPAGCYLFVLPLLSIKYRPIGKVPYQFIIVIHYFCNNSPNSSVLSAKNCHIRHKFLWVLFNIEYISYKLHWGGIRG